MATALVVFDGTRVNASDANTNWGHWGGSGGAPAAEAPNAYQNSLAVNKKVTSTSALQGIDYDPAAAALDMTAAANRLWFVKMYVATFGDLDATFGMSAGIGSSNSDFYVYNVAGTGANLSVYNTYPPQGGYLLTSIDPNIAAWRDSTTGTPAITAIDWFGGQTQAVVGGAKNENFAVDAIDVGTGLTITAGDGASSPGTFLDFVVFDQDTITNRYGVVSGSGNIVRSVGLLTIGSASVTEFDDSDTILLFPDGYHSEGLVGVYIDMSHADSIVAISSLIIGEGTIQTLDADDTRPDFTVNGTLGTCDINGTLQNFKTITLSTIVDLINADIECETFVQDGSCVEFTIIRTNSAADEACLIDPDFDTVLSNVTSTEFIQSGLGHAVEFTSIGTHTPSDVMFSGYGADGTSSAAVLNSSGGLVTINVIERGDIPTVTNTGGGSTTTVNQFVLILIIVKDSSGIAIEGARVRITQDSDSSVVLEGVTNVAGIVVNASFNFISSQAITGIVRKGTTTPLFKQNTFVGTVTSLGFSNTVIMVDDE